MSEETPAAELPQQPVAATPSARSRTSSLPPWLPFFLLAVVPAVIVGGLVYALSGSGSDSGGGAGVVDGFIRRSVSGGDPVFSYGGKMPPEFPKDFPSYGNASIVASFSLPSADGTSYFAVLSTSASTDEAYKYYLQALDKDAWQIEAAQSSSDFTGILFSRPDNPDISGDISIIHSDIDNSTSIFVSVQDLGTTATQSGSDPFVLRPSRPLPPGFPNDIPIFKGKSESVVVDTYIQKGGGFQSFYVAFITKDSQNDVISFYRQEFGKRGWSITDSDTTANSFALGIDFQDGPKQEVQGSVSADSFEDDSSYTRVELFLQVSASRGRGN